MSLMGIVIVKFSLFSEYITGGFFTLKEESVFTGYCNKTLLIKRMFDFFIKIEITILILPTL